MPTATTETPTAKAVSSLWRPIGRSKACERPSSASTAPTGTIAVNTATRRAAAALRRRVGLASLFRLRTLTATRHTGQ